MPRIAAVAFDLDGLMINTEEAFNIAGHELLGRRNHRLTSDVLRLMMGRRSAEAFAVLIDHYRLTDTIEELQSEYRGYFWRALEGRLAFMPGLETLLEKIESCGLPKAVCTSSERAYLESMLGRFALQPRFAVMLGAEDVQRGKPDPEIYTTAAKRLGVSPENLMVLEDSENGVRAAAAAGAFAIAVPHEHCEGLDYSTASLVVPSLDSPELLSLFA